MKRIFLTLLVLELLSACGTKGSSSAPVIGTGPCAGLQVGSWIGVNTNHVHIVLDDQCKGTTTYCNEVFTYTLNGTTATLNISSTNGGPECLPIGINTCVVSFLANQNNNQISVACGAGKAINDNYNRQ